MLGFDAPRVSQQIKEQPQPVPPTNLWRSGSQPPELFASLFNMLCGCSSDDHYS
jgi:hypothetical protein